MEHFKGIFLNFIVRLLEALINIQKEKERQKVSIERC